MAITMDGFPRETLDTGVMTQDAPKPHSLALLSSIAVMVSNNSTEELELRQQEQRSSFASRTSKGFDEGCENLKRSKRRSGSISRSFSTRNLQQAAARSSSLPLFLEQREEHKKPRRQASPQLSPYSTFILPLTQSAPSEMSSNPAPTVIHNDEEPPRPASEQKPEPMMGAQAKAPTAPATTESTKATAPDDLTKNIYRSYEIQLPQYSLDPLVTSSANSSSSTIVDDYNHDVNTCTPLLDPPRLPSATESFKITEKSLEEKNSWGWYA